MTSSGNVSRMIDVGDSFTGSATSRATRCSEKPQGRTLPGPTAVHAKEILHDVACGPAGRTSKRDRPKPGGLGQSATRPRCAEGDRTSGEVLRYRPVVAVSRGRRSRRRANRAGDAGLIRLSVMARSRIRQTDRGAEAPRQADVDAACDPS
jgi:hypothetical protein